jgi:Holliday junction resolvasome RuvABC ATP-dependent DNA helicase subunit
MTMTTSQRDLFLITGIPGTGKTTLADTLAKDFGFVHHDLEKKQTLDPLAVNPLQFIADIVSRNRDTVVTWGYAPDDPAAGAARDRQPFTVP